MAFTARHAARRLVAASTVSSVASLGLSSGIFLHLPFSIGRCLPPRARLQQRIHRHLHRPPAPEAAVVAAPGCFAGLPATPYGSSIDRLLLVLRPFAPAAFTAFIATTASADSSPALTGEVSPGKVHELSARAVRLYLMRLSVTVGFRVGSHAHRPHCGLTAGSCSYGRAFATDFFQLNPSRFPPCPSLRLSSLIPIISFQMTSSCPCRAHDPWACAHLQVCAGMSDPIAAVRAPESAAPSVPKGHRILPTTPRLLFWPSVLSVSRSCAGYKIRIYLFI